MTVLFGYADYDFPYGRDRIREMWMKNRRPFDYKSTNVEMLYKLCVDVVKCPVYYTVQYDLNTLLQNLKIMKVFPGMAFDIRLEMTVKFEDSDDEILSLDFQRSGLFKVTLFMTMANNDKRWRGRKPAQVLLDLNTKDVRRFDNTGCYALFYDKESNRLYHAEFTDDLQVVIRYEVPGEPAVSLCQFPNSLEALRNFVLSVRSDDLFFVSSNKYGMEIFYYNIRDKFQFLCELDGLLVDFIQNGNRIIVRTAKCVSLYVMNPDHGIVNVWEKRTLGCDRMDDSTYIYGFGDRIEFLDYHTQI
ncbi:unnamed protein product [Bursaphelenchus xylophilus]|uniref:(pine wood nematode) hypothetical protein n=1 Tax=Bursaphelenchus xylophilus TaxID=6326 RepID=A0A1I7RPI1_BURXY|nr:unnamed protein product [Bursaphelenchus xylophilus]CAG9096059.1 unnamed protein product [Bursaphelenchus xylophilus]